MFSSDISLDAAQLVMKSMEDIRMYIQDYVWEGASAESIFGYATSATWDLLLVHK